MKPNAFVKMRSWKTISHGLSNSHCGIKLFTSGWPKIKIDTTSMEPVTIILPSRAIASFLCSLELAIILDPKMVANNKLATDIRRINENVSNQSLILVYHPNANRMHVCRYCSWWARLGLNQRPLRCQRSALPLSYAPIFRLLVNHHYGINTEKQVMARA